MAATVKRNIWYWSGTIPPLRTYKIAGSQGLQIAGAPFYLATTYGYATKCVTAASDEQERHGLLTKEILTEKSAGDTVRLAMLRTGTIWAVFVENNDSDAAAAQTMVGKNYGDRIATGTGKIGYTTVDINSSTYTVWKCQDIASNVEPSRFTTSDNPGVALMSFLQTSIEVSET